MGKLGRGGGEEGRRGGGEEGRRGGGEEGRRGRGEEGRRGRKEAEEDDIHCHSAAFIRSGNDYSQPPVISTFYY